MEEKNETVNFSVNIQDSGSAKTANALNEFISQFPEYNSDGDYLTRDVNFSFYGESMLERICGLLLSANLSLLNITNASSICDQPQKSFLLPWYHEVFWYILFGAMVIVAAGGNIIVIYIVLADRKMRSVTNIFLVNLSIADAMNATLNVVFNFTYMLNNLHWPFGRVYCKISEFVSVLSIAASVFTLMAIAFDRYWAIMYPLRTRIGVRTTMIIVVGIWLCSVALSFPNILYYTTQEVPVENGVTRLMCFPKWPDGEVEESDAGFMYNIFVMLLTYILPVMCMAFTYTRMGILLWGSRGVGEQTPGQRESMRAKRKVVKMMIVVVVIFSVCWLPFHLYFILSKTVPTINTYEHIQNIYLFIYWLAMSNSMYNPIIYCWLNDKFRNGFKSVFHRWCPCLPWCVPTTTLRPGQTITTYYSSAGSPDFARRHGTARARSIALHAISSKSSTPSTVSSRYYNGHSNRSSSAVNSTIHSFNSSVNPSLDTSIADRSGSFSSTRQYQVQLRQHQQYQQQRFEQQQKQLFDSDQNDKVLLKSLTEKQNLPKLDIVDLTNSVNAEVGSNAELLSSKLITESDKESPPPPYIDETPEKPELPSIEFEASPVEKLFGSSSDDKLLDLKSASDNSATEEEG